MRTRPARTRQARQRWLPALSAGFVLLGSLTATRATGSPSDGIALGTSRTRIAAAQARVDDLRAQLETGGFEEAVRAVLPPGSPAPTLTSTSTGPVTGLLSAVGQAIELLEDPAAAPRGDLLSAISRPSTRSATATSPFEVEALGSVLAGREPGWVAAMRDAQARASLTIARALDRHLAKLTARDASVTDREAAGCDVHEDLPFLCVGSETDNTYTADAALLIDLGGNDTYRNSAGGAPFPTEQGLVPVSVNVDLGGDDVYEAPAPQPSQVPEFPGSFQVAQGAGGPGGVGFAVDLGGTDTYSAALPAPPSQPGLYLGVAQGSGFTGSGFLFDAAGSDSYRLEGPPPDDSLIEMVAQGSGLFGSGLLVDRGTAPDHYVVDAGEARADPVRELHGGRVVHAQGASNGAYAVLFDDGGSDVFEVSADSTSPEGSIPQNFQTTCPGNGPFPCLWLVAQGFAAGNGFVGALLEGSGDTEYSMDVEGAGFVWVIAQGQGAAIVGGLGVADDRGGDDLYSSDVLVSSELRLVKAECGGSSQCSASASVDAGLCSCQWVLSQGSGFTGPGSLGFLHDAAGDDEYRVVGLAEMDVELEDRLASPTKPPSLEVKGYGPGELVVQGAGWVLASGALQDDAGTDDYLTEWRKTLHAAATSANATGEPDVLAIQPGGFLHAAQGAINGQGHGGTLLDLGGSGDSFEAIVTRDASAEPASARVLTAWGHWPSFHAGFGGELVALGDDPTIVGRPARPTCITSSARRGYGTWTDCSPYQGGLGAFDKVFDFIPVGFGTAPEARGAEPGFTVISPDSATDGGSVATGARLVDAAGQPVEGAPIHFTVQYTDAGCIPAPCDVWYSSWKVEAVTDAEGIARAEVPLTFSEFGQNPTGRLFRVLAGYDGDPAVGLTPAHASKPFSLA